jgi:hypothetical protein
LSVVSSCERSGKVVLGCRKVAKPEGYALDIDLIDNA